MTDLAVIAAPWALHVQGEAAEARKLDRLETMPDNVPTEAARIFRQLNLELTPRTAADNVALARAGSLISRIPDLWNVVAMRVNRVAILHCADQCYDVSHSDPAWPGLICVSMPPSTPVGDLRLAEGIIHEAMHHHLSAVEATTSLVASNRAAYSPWKMSERPASGVLHGTYVFGCIAHALGRLINEGLLDASQSLHAKNRISEIGKELEFIDHEILLAALTEKGRHVHALAIGAVRSVRFESK